MRYLGIDYGRKRVGIAVSDDDGKIAFPKEPIIGSGSGMGRIVRAVSVLVRGEKIEKIVLGIPLDARGSETDMSREVRQFGEAVGREISLPIEFENELFTTHLVEGAGIPQERADGAAAAVILQSYLDRINKGT